MCLGISRTFLPESHVHISLGARRDARVCGLQWRQLLTFARGLPAARKSFLPSRYASLCLQNVNANLLGGVVNKFDSKKSGYGYYYYYADYGYYAEDDVDNHKIG